MPTKWKIKWKEMGPSDSAGQIFWRTQSTVTGTFKTVVGSTYSNPTIDFIVNRRRRVWLDERQQEKPKLPIYNYSIDVVGAGKAGTSFNMMVSTRFDAVGRDCFLDLARMKYRLSGEDPHFDCRLEAGVWRAIINGDIQTRNPFYAALWLAMAPLLLEMSQAPDMKKMENLFLQRMSDEGMMKASAKSMGRNISKKAREDFSGQRWNELFRRAKNTTGGKPRFSLVGAKGYLYKYDGYSGGHRELDGIIALLEEYNISCETSEEDSPLNVSSYRYKYRFEDGGLFIYAGNYFFGSPGHGAFVVGFKALRWLLDKLGIEQPRTFKNEGGLE